MKTINANGTTTSKMYLPSSKAQKLQNRNAGAIVGGTIAGVAAIFAVIGIATFVRRRRGWKPSGRRSFLPPDARNVDSQRTVSPFDPNSFDANRRDSGISAEQQPLVIGDPEAEMVALHGRSYSMHAVLPPLRQEPVAPVPAGLSDKELARLRAESLSSPQRQNFRISALNMSQPMPPLNTFTGPGEPALDTRRLHSEFESLRQEVVRLREEGMAFVAPPSYAEGRE